MLPSIPCLPRGQHRACYQKELNQHNEQARAALKYSSKKPTRRDARHQADETRKRHNEKTKQHTRDETDTTTRESSCEVSSDLARPGSHLGRQSPRAATLRDPTPTWSGTPGSRKVRTDLAIRIVHITTFSKDIIPLPCERSCRTILTFVQVVHRR